MQTCEVLYCWFCAIVIGAVVVWLGTIGSVVSAIHWYLLGILVRVDATRAVGVVHTALTDSLIESECLSNSSIVSGAVTIP